jgi:acyl-coenzyme A synthetase/AMP-(fatty) acid ligase
VNINDENKIAMPPLKVLSHVEVDLVEDSQIAISSAALFTARVDWKTKSGESPWAEVLWQAGDWYVTSDTGAVTASAPGEVYLHPKGRVDDQIKISGELISLPEARTKFSQTVADTDLSWALLTQPNTRLGAEVILAVAHPADIKSQEVLLNLIGNYNRKVLPPMRIRAVYFLKEIPKTAIGKIKVSEIKNIIKIETVN